MGRYFRLKRQRPKGDGSHSLGITSSGPATIAAKNPSISSRSVPMSSRCKAELLRWRSLPGPEFSAFVFANPHRIETHLKDVRRAWPKTLKAAGLSHFWLYDLRSTFASRLRQAGVSPLFVAQISGHSSPSILQTYAKAIDEYCRSAISKMEPLRGARSAQSTNRPDQTNQTTVQ